MALSRFPAPLLSERNEEMAQRAVRGDYFVTGEEIARMRRKDVAMNTEIKDAGHGRD